MHHEQSQDNKKSTPTSDIAPGAPIWYRSASGVHNNQDKGHGYSAHDPVSLTSNDTRNNSSGYRSGSGVTRFGTISLEKDQYVGPHGSVIDLLITRDGGTVGDQVVTLKIDRETPGVNNTARVGSVRGEVVDGFSTCQVDVDLEILNDPDYVFWDKPTETLAILLKDGQRQTNLRILLPYKTQVKSMSPQILKQPLTYLVDEYYSTGHSSINSKLKAYNEDLYMSLEHQPENRVINNHQVTYQVATLPVPGWWTDFAGEDRVGIDGKMYGREIDRWSTVAVPITGLVANPPKYTVGKIRNVEATAYLRLDDLESPPISGTTLWATLTGEWSLEPKTKTDLARSYVFGTSGYYYEYTGDVNTTGTLTVDPSATDYLKIHPVYEKIQYNGSDVNLKIGSGYVSRVTTLGQDPDSVDPNPVSPGRGGNITWGDYADSELDPGGESEFRWFQIPELEKQKYGDQFGIGHQSNPLFHWEGVDQGALTSGLKYVLVNSGPDYVDLTQNNPLLTNTPWSVTGELSAFHYLQSLPSQGADVENGKNRLYDSWVAQETVVEKLSASLTDLDQTNYMNELVLYDLTQLPHDADKSRVNKNNLKGYYMSCVDHRDVELNFIFGSYETEPVYKLGDNRKVKIIIDKQSPYSTETHAEIENLISSTTGEPAQVLRENVIKHNNTLGITWQTGDSWSDHGYNTPGARRTASYVPQLTAGPTGDSLLVRLFDQPVGLTITPTFTGYTTTGVISSDDVTFLSLIPGVFDSESFSDPIDPADAEPGTVSLSAVIHTNTAGVESVEPMLVVDLKTNNTPVIDVPSMALVDSDTGESKSLWLYMSNPGGKPLTVMLDQMTSPDPDPLITSNQVLTQGPTQLGAYQGEAVYYWYSKYTNTPSELYSVNLSDATVYADYVTFLGGVDTNKMVQFELNPNDMDDMLYNIDPNNIVSNTGESYSTDPGETITVKQIFQLYTPGEAIVQGTITVNFIY